MALDVWTQPSGYTLGTFPEQLEINLTLPVHNDTGVSYSVISGALPGGTFLTDNRIAGNPYIVANQSSYTFCIRASFGSLFSDRTFNILVSGSNPPTFVTPSGALAVGVHKQLYALDQTLINYQLEAFDLNTANNVKLSFSILSGDGELPPGLTLTESGLITGFLEPLYKITPQDGSGAYDESIFDAVAYDFGQGALSNTSDGYDNKQFDDISYDYAQPDLTAVTLSRNYQFKVTLTDGINYAQRLFRILIIGDDTFRADSTVLDGYVGGLFTSDVTYIRRPVWKTNSNLGTYRANNYITIPLALYSKDSVFFRLDATNQEVYAISSKISAGDNTLGNNRLTITDVIGTPVAGQFLSFDFYLDGATEYLYQIQSVTPITNGYRLTLTSNLLITIPDKTVFYIGSKSILPTGLAFDENSCELYGVSPYQPAITKTFSFTVVATRYGKNDEYINASRTFRVSLIGEVNSVITWISNTDLGSIDANYDCLLKISAATTIPNAVLVYTLTDGYLPSGLNLNVDGEIVGRPRQYYNPDIGSGIITFDDRYTMFDSGLTSFDTVYTFTVSVQDQFGYSASTKTFTLKINLPDTLQYSNIFVQPLLPIKQRSNWQEFINDTTIFTPSSVYRPNDSSFGVQTRLEMLVYAGIETRTAAEYVSAIGLNHKRKRFLFNGLKTAVALDSSNNTIYEVIYMNMQDPREELNYAYLPQKILVDGLTSNPITVDLTSKLEYDIRTDSTGYVAGSYEIRGYYPNSINNWRDRLSNGITNTERNYLPLWMRSIQPGSRDQLGYVTAIPICFCLPGTSAAILLNIKNSGFDFKQIDYTVDRYTITAVLNDLLQVKESDKYLVFRNDRITV